MADHGEESRFPYRAASTAFVGWTGSCVGSVWKSPAGHFRMPRL